MPGRKLPRTSSALLSAAAGGAVCLSGGGAAHAATGDIAASNTGFTSFYFPIRLRAFNSQAEWQIGQDFTWTTTCTPTSTFTTTTTVTTTTTTTTYTSTGGSVFPRTHQHTHMNQHVNTNTGSTCTSYLTATGPAYFVANAAEAVNGTYFAHAHDAGVTINGAMPDGFSNSRRVPPSQSNKYIAVQFDASGTKYGWLHLVGTCSCGQIMFLDKWGYDPTGGELKTLSRSVVTRALPLADGRTQLHWTTKNESGISRYEIQQQDATGKWTAIGAETPGPAHYSVTVSKAGMYRVVAEKTDGSMETTAF